MKRLESYRSTRKKQLQKVSFVKDKRMKIKIYKNINFTQRRYDA